MAEATETEATDSPNQRLCKGCREWIDARAPSCYLCGADGPERNPAINPQAAEWAAGLHQAGNRALQEKRVGSSIPQRPSGAGPSKLYNVPGAQGLAAHYKSELKNAGFVE